MVKDNYNDLNMRRKMSIPEELEYLARYSIRTYNNGRNYPGFLEHAYQECLKNASLKEHGNLKLKSV